MPARVLGLAVHRGVSDPLAIRDLTDDERASANALYRAIQFAVTPPDAIALVAELAGVRVGLGRLVALAPGVTELGGIWTDEAVRGRGIARAMVSALLARFEHRAGGGAPVEPADRGRGPGGGGLEGRGPELHGGARDGLEGRGPGPRGDGPERANRAASSLWCIPFAHLAAFYRSFGFADLPPPWPPPVAAKVAACVAARLPPVVVLAR